MSSQKLWIVLTLAWLVHGFSAPKEITKENFDSEVVSSGRVWLLEFHSNMCGSCREFKPTFKSVVSQLEKQSIKLEIGLVGIDDNDAMELAAKLSVLDEGIPNVRLFSTSSDSTGIKIMPGSLLSQQVLVQRIKTHVKGLKRDTQGYYIKVSDEL